MTSEPADIDAFDRFPNAASFVRKLGIRLPICQAVMDLGSGMAELSAAISEAGGLGGMGVTWHTGDEVAAFVSRARALTKAPFAVGYVLSFEPTTLPIALESGAPIVQFSWGTPKPETATLVRSFGAKIGMQVSSLGGAKQALDLGVDYLSIQGQEAGGHVQASASWRETIGAVIQAAGSVPVLVAGGLANGKALREVLSLGCAGGVFGTRFLATEESPSHPSYKKRLMHASASDTMLTVCFDGRLVQCAPSRPAQRDGRNLGGRGLRPGGIASRRRRHRRLSGQSAARAILHLRAEPADDRSGSHADGALCR